MPPHDILNRIQRFDSGGRRASGGFALDGLLAQFLDGLKDRQHDSVGGTHVGPDSSAGMGFSSRLML